MSIQFHIEKRDAIGHWEYVMGYGTEEQAHKALPYWRRDTKRDLRIVRVERQEICLDTLTHTSTAIAAAPKLAGEE